MPPSWLYNLSRREREAMENYIQESLAAGIIHRSCSQMQVLFSCPRCLACSFHIQCVHPVWVSSVFTHTGSSVDTRCPHCQTQRPSCLAYASGGALTRVPCIYVCYKVTVVFQLHCLLTGCLKEYVTEWRESLDMIENVWLLCNLGSLSE